MPHHRVATSRPAPPSERAGHAALAPVWPPGRLRWRSLLDALLADAQIEASEAQRVAQRCAAGESAQHPLLRLCSVGLRRSGGALFDRPALLVWLAARSGLAHWRIDPLKVDVAHVTDAMGLVFAQRHAILPVQINAAEVVVACSEPGLSDWVDEVERQTHRRVRRVLADPQDIARYTVEFYALAKSVRAAARSGGAQGTNFEQLVELGRGHKTLDANDAGVVQLVDWLWQYAFEQRASDIHLEPRREQGQVRFRIDGVLHPVYQMPAGVFAAAIARVKLLARMDVIEKRRPQDGRIKTRNSGGAEIEMRVATLPTAFGEKMVMRVFDPESAVKDLAELGFSSHDAACWEALVTRPNGIILVTGPTGSGKTTTLYATLKRLATDAVNVSTVEDPIEMIEPAFNQTQVQPQLDLGFAQGLRALMRQDPDILMVGEIRDRETADMAVQAALTGHLVISSLHTNDAPSAVTRLIELGVPPYLISATLLGVLAQRLVRTLCPYCREPDPSLPAAALQEVVQPWTLGAAHSPQRAPGCVECRMTGYRGRLGLYELLSVSAPFRALISTTPDLDALRRQAIADGMRPLRLAGVLRVAQGLTSLPEVLTNTPLLA